MGCGTYVKMTEKMGRGVFAEIDYKKGDIILIDHALIIPEKEVKGTLSNYVYDYSVYAPKMVCMALGHGSLFNHSKKPNVEYHVLPESRLFGDRQLPQIVYMARTKIRAGEQLFIDYGYEPVKPKKRRKNGKK